MSNNEWISKTEYYDEEAHKINAVKGSESADLALIINVTRDCLISHAIAGVSVDCSGEKTIDEVAEYFVKPLLREEDKQRTYSLFNRENILQAFECGVYNTKFEFLKEDEELGPRWFSATMNIIQQKDDGAICCYVYASDIDEIHKTIMALEGVMDETMDFVFCLDLATGKARMLKRNARITKLAASDQYDINKDLPVLISALVPSEDRERVRKFVNVESWKLQLEKRPELSFNFRVMDGDTELYKKVMIRYLDPKYKTAMVISQVDITDVFRENERQKRNLSKALDAAKQANDSKTEFLSRFSHEIRTPLNAVIGLTGLAKSKIDDAEYMKHCIDKIDDSSQYLLSLINDILDVSRIETGKIHLHMESVNLKSFLEGVLEIEKPAANSKLIYLKSEICEKSDCTYSFDPIRLKQVLSNLLQNAIKFTPRYGTVSFDCRVIKDSEECSQLEFIVKDNGVGINSDFLPKVFLAFEQEYTGNTTAYGGTGLGLAISKNIVDLMGGTIEVASAKGAGAEFKITVTFAKAEEAVPDTAAADVSDYRFAGHRILLAEDNPINCEIAKELMVQRGLEVDVAENGKEALNAYMKNPPQTYSLIVMDVRMPYMDGLTSTKMIRSSGKSDSLTIPILALTANAFEEDVQKSKDAGMNAHLTKPIDPKDFYNAIKLAIGGKLSF